MTGKKIILRSPESKLDEPVEPELIPAAVPHIRLAQLACNRLYIFILQVNGSRRSQKTKGHWGSIAAACHTAQHNTPDELGVPELLPATVQYIRRVTPHEVG